MGSGIMKNCAIGPIYEEHRDYRLRVGPVTRDYGLTERAEVPMDSFDVYDKQHPR